MLLDGELQLAESRVPIRLLAVESLGAKFANPVCQAAAWHKKEPISGATLR